MGTKNQTSSSSGTSNGSSTTTLSPQVQAAYSSLLSSIGGAGAGTNGATTAASSGLGTLAANSNPAYGSAASTLSSAATPAYSTVQNYLSPYISQQLQSQIALENQQNAQQQQGVVGNAAAQGALGGNRVGVAQGILAGQQDLANNATNSGLLNTAYQQALSGALTGQQNETAAGTAQTNLGSSQTASSLSTLLGQLEAGNSQFSNLGTLSGAAGGLSNSGATTTSSGATTGTETTPGANILSQLLSAGTAVAGLYARGGVVPHFDDGGVVGQLADQRQTGVQGAENNSASVMQSLQQMTQQAQQQNQPQQPSAEQQQGAANIRSWLTPQASLPAGVGETGGYGSSYAGGGVVPRRGYDDGGSVDPGLSSLPTVDYAALLAHLANSAAPSNDNTVPPDATPMPMAVNSGLVPGLGSVDMSSNSNDPIAAISPRLPQGMSRTDSQGLPYAASSNVVPMMRAPSPGVVPAAPAMAPAPQSAGVVPVGLSSGAPPPATPITVRSNNPGAIEDGPWARQQPGYAGSNGNFAVFNSPQAGQAAHVSLLGNYLAGGTNTIQGITNKYAPQSGNAPGSTANYASYVAQRTGIPPNATVSQADLPAIAQAQSEWESGNKSGNTASGTGAATAPGLSGAVAAAPAGGMPGGVVPVSPNVPDPQSGNYSSNIREAMASLFAGHGLNLSPDARGALLAAAGAMGSGTSPFALTNINAGLSAGVKQYYDAQKNARDNAATQAQSIATQAEAARTAVATANEATKFTQNGLGFNESQVNPDGSVSIGRLPYGNVPVLGAPGGTGAPPAGAPATQTGAAGPSTPSTGAAAQGAGDIPRFTPTEFPTQVNTDQGLQSLQSAGQEQFVAPAVQAATTAHQADASMSQLAALASRLPTSGPLTQGAGFADRTAWVNAANTVATAMGQKPFVNADDLATAEGVKKVSTQLQAALADTWKSDPAASTIALASSGSPSGENTRAGLFEIIGNGLALNRRAEDRAGYFNRWSGLNSGVMNGFPQGSADDYFNSFHPPATYIAAGKVIGSSLAGTPVAVSNADVYGVLPSGTLYVGPDGKQHRKQ